MKIINGIQHLGVGVENHEASWKWYRKFFGMDIPFFDAEAPAPLMNVYTRNETITKRAAMIMNLKGGCAMEVVKATSFKPTHPKHEVELGDLGIFIGKIKAPDVKAAFEYFKVNGANLQGKLSKTPNGEDTFYVKDPNNLVFQVIPDQEYYTRSNSITGGGKGCTIGVSNIDKALKLYCELLGYDRIVYDQTGVFDDFQPLLGGDRKYRRVLLTQANRPTGGFNKIGGPSHIELVQDLSDRQPNKIFEGRIWADIGFVHLGFDVRGMAQIEQELTAAGYPFTCDTKEILDMGKTRVHCVYIEDPDGTWLELIEVYKIPIIEKLGIFLNVEKRSPEQPLPDMMLKAMKFMRVKD